MTKYKLNFKANDDALEGSNIYFKTKAFLEKQYSQVEDRTETFSSPDTFGNSTIITFYFKSSWLRGGYVELKLYVNKKYVSKMNTTLRTFAGFTISELKFFDRLGYEIHPTMEKETGQDITDWFGEV